MRLRCVGVGVLVWAGVMLGGSVGAQTGTGSALGRQIEAMIAEPAVARAHWGVMVRAMDGTAEGGVIYGLNEGQFFQPASNAKLFTTAAAMALLGGERRFETEVARVGVLSEDGTTLRGDVLLVGGGDANLSGRELPYVSPALRPKRTVGFVNPSDVPAADPLRSLAAMADAVRASGLKVVMGDVVGDDRLWPWEPYPQDWSIDDAVWGYGAPVSALSVQDNQMRLTVTPSREVGGAAAVDLEQAAPYYRVEGQVVTAPAKSTAGGVQVERAPGSRVLRVYGQIAADAGVDVEEVAIADPAEYAAMALRSMLEARGVEVRGRALARHSMPEMAGGFLEMVRRPLPELVPDASGRYRPSTFVPSLLQDSCAGCGAADPQRVTVLGRWSSPEVGTDVVLTNKVSQNLHAEMLLHHLANAYGGLGQANGTTAEGARVVRQFLINAGIDEGDFVFYDGSGLSGHDLVTPRATVRLLTWASTQPWFAAWRASLPVGGVDGSLAARFAKGPLKGRVFAKTGTLGEARALSGYAVCASGRTVAFSVMVTDHAPGGRADQEVMDRIVGAIAAAE